MKKLFSVIFIIAFITGGSIYSQDNLGLYDNPLTAEMPPVFSNLITDAISTDTWWPANTFPSLPSGTYFQASAWLGDTLYVHDPGTTGLGATTIRRYTWNGTWTLGVPLPSSLVGGTLTACNGKLYYIGGGTGTITAGTTTNVEYDPSTGTWTTKAPLPVPLSAHGAANWGDSVIFVVGGPYTGSGTNLAVHYYRVGSNTWGTIANSLPSGQGRRTFAFGIEENKLYMGCGFNTAFLSTFYIGTIGANASMLTWAAGPIVPGVALSRPGGWAGYGRFYIVAGEMSGGGYSTVTQVYNIAGNSWSNIAGKPVGCSNIFSATVGKNINDTVRVVVPGCYDGSANPAFDVLQANYHPTVGIIQTSEIATQYMLSQNYPNPFNPSTRINFAVPKAGNVNITVSDITGRTVSVLLNEHKGSGNYTLDFDASGLSSGVYFYTIRSNDFNKTMKMLLVK